MATLRRRLPARLEKFLVTAKDTAGWYVAGLPSFEPGWKLKAKFFEPTSKAVRTAGELVPLCRLGSESSFLAVRVADPRCPVVMVDGVGGVCDVSESLEAFAATLLRRDDATPFEQLEKAVFEASALCEAKKWNQVVALLDPLLRAAPARPPQSMHRRLREAYRQRAVARGALGRKAQARADFETALALGDGYAGLNLLEQELAEGRFEEVIARGEAMDRGFLDEYCLHWTRRYLALAFLQLGKLAAALERLTQIRQRRSGQAEEATWLADTGKALDELVKKGGPPGALAAKAREAFDRLHRAKK